MADTPAERAPFAGFSPDALQFLADLAANNDRAWFKPRKADYERLIKEPLEALCVALADRFDALRLPLEADPRRSPFRIYRDVRFSNDKSPVQDGPGRRVPLAGFARRRRSGRAVPWAATSTWSPATSSSAVACGTLSALGWQRSARRSIATPAASSGPSRNRASCRSSTR